MPRRDGTGPMGRGSMTGRSMGFCNTAKFAGRIGALGFGLGLGCRRNFGRSFERGFGRNVISNESNVEDEKKLLMQEKTILEERLNLINNQLNTEEDDK